MTSPEDQTTSETQHSMTDSTDARTTAGQKKQKPRHRASIACASCRDRRIRCVVPPGEAECTQCKRSGVECIIRNDDERRRPISRAYMSSLTERINLLEGMLKQSGTDVPPAEHPPMTRHAQPVDENQIRKVSRSRSKPRVYGTSSSNADNSHSSPSSQPDDLIFDREGSTSNRGEDSESAASAPSPSMIPPPKKDGMISRLLSTRGHLSFDQLSGRLRYFGPTTNCHVHSEFGMFFEESRDYYEQTKRAERAIRGLSMETYEYLMALFWQNYNSYMHVVHREAFMEDREAGNTNYYSPFLHICVLAMGFRFADRNRPDMKRITVAPRESSLHREAKYMLEFELERPGGITSVVAMLLLGDMECAVGRDNLGWLYAGMAVRIAFDIGLHLDTRSSGMSQREIDIRRMTLWACVIYDKYWALFLGRPTSMKSSDLEINRLSKQFERLGTCKPVGNNHELDTRIYEALLDLMELAGKITEIEPRANIAEETVIDRDAYLRMAALDREFGSWYARLPENLRWNPDNIRTAPLSFFLLHQQYHVALILLHRPFAMYEENAGDGSNDENSSHTDFSALSRAVCTKQAIRVAKIFWHHRQRFDTKQIPVTGVQHAGTAAIALVAALAFLKDANDRGNKMQYLEFLSVVMQDMAHTYQPAERMHIVLQAVLSEMRGSPPPSGSANSPLSYMASRLVPARRDSGGLEDHSHMIPSKRRQMARPRPSFASSDLAIDPSLSRRGDDGFSMITPHSDLSGWPGTAISDATGDGNVVPTSWLSRTTPSGDGDLDMNDVSVLATVHFPELRHLPPVGDNAVPNLDFLSFGGAVEDWRDWGLQNTGYSDLSSSRFEQAFAGV